MNVVDAVFAVHDFLDRLEVEHAFGGALALAYYADPRGTLDVDVNVFTPFAGAEELVGRFEALGLEPELSAAEWIPVAGVRLVQPGEPVHVDLFFSIDDHYREIAGRIRWYPFGAEHRQLPFLSMEDLVVFKLSFGRDTDWVDLRRLVAGHPDIDVGYVERQLVGIRGPTMHPRLARIRMMAREAASGSA